MIDLHCHLLPSLDDGPADLDTALEMARIAVADGITVVACTPHILPGLYDNRGPEIVAALDRFAASLNGAGIELRIVAGADIHILPDLITALRSGRALTLGGSRYLLLEPPHYVLPPRIEDTVFEVTAAGYCPILTHPERLAWIETNFELIDRLSRRGVWMQITAGSLTGRFGSRARYWAERLLDDGLVHIIATDAHDCGRRAPLLRDAYCLAIRRVGDDEARRLVIGRPQAVLDDVEPSRVQPPVRRDQRGARREKPRGWRFW